MQGKGAATRTNRRSLSVAFLSLLGALGAVAAVEATPVAAAAPPHRAHRAQIVVHPGDGLRPVHPGLFGVNHRYPYDGFGMWDSSTGNVHELFDRRFAAAGFRAMRFPGGLVANTYHWKRAIGPLPARSLNVNGRSGEPLANGFGPDELGRFISERGIQAMMLANFATGTAQEAADWVEYMNAPVGTNPNGGVAWAQERAANGHPEPYDARTWEIGNELYQSGQAYWMGHGPIAERTRKYVFGGATTFKKQRVGKPWDHQYSAAISDGTAAQSFQVHYPPVKPDKRFIVRVDDKLWSRVRELSGAPADANVYELDPASGKIHFGDGVHGAIPLDGDVVRATYRSGPHDGFVDFYTAMKAADPSIQVGSCFRNGAFLSLMGKDRPYDFVVAHIYSHMPPRGFHGARQFHDGVMSLAAKRANVVSDLRHAIRRNAGSLSQQIDVVVSEYGMSFGRHHNGPTRNYVRSLDQALWVALELQRWMQLGVTLAGKQSLIDFNRSHAPPGARALGPSEQALIGPAPKYVASATARVFRLLTPTSGDRVVRTAVQRNPSRHIYSGKNMAMLSAIATKAPRGALDLSVVNKARTWRIPATVAVKGHRIRSATTRELVGPSYSSYNNPSHPHRVDIRTRNRWVMSHRMKLKLPPHSVTVLKLRRRAG